MSFRTIIITKKAKLSYQNNYMLVRNDELKKIYLNEVDTIIIDSLQVSMTTYLIMELSKRNIKVVYCDMEHNPISELVPYYGSHNTSKKITQQANWQQDHKDFVWKHVIKQKIHNQAQILKDNGHVEEEMLNIYLLDVKVGDHTNREGHGAKVYFNSLFGNDFTRKIKNDKNAALDYGYSILLSTFNKEIVKRGHVTQLGIHHHNEFNPYNLSCDLMEPFRPIIDQFVIKHPKVFDNYYKYDLVNLLNKQFIFENKNYRLKDIIRIYTRKILICLNEGKLEEIPGFWL